MDGPASVYHSQASCSLSPSPHAMMLATVILQESASFQANAPVGTGLEWLTLGSVLVPAVLLVFLVYWGAQETV